MGRSTAWLSLTGGVAILGYGMFRLLQPQPEWIPMILGLLIVAFSVSKIAKSRAQRKESDGEKEG